MGGYQQPMMGGYQQPQMQCYCGKCNNCMQWMNQIPPEYAEKDMDIVTCDVCNQDIPI